MECSEETPALTPAPETELLAPAGNWECARAAVANGADAIYFGLSRFNARLRAENFTDEDLPDLMGYLHRHGVRGFVAFNTLLFPGELDAAARQLVVLEHAGVDAIIVQDLGLARLARLLVPRLELHASTQMTITSPEGLAFVDRHVRLDRAVIARENSLPEIRLFQADRPGAVPLESFVHGALCVAYSGQCLTSESLGQRSANRGECAQACRMPYELVVDGQTVDLGDKRYLLSPKDLAGYAEIPELLSLGVRSFKIEGRLKSPEYVAAVTRVYRKALDAAVAERPCPVSGGDRYELEMSFSRGLSTGWLRGVDNQTLVHARFGKKRGAFLGPIRAVGRDWMELDLEGPVSPGDGVVIDTGGDTDREQGGRVFEVAGNRIHLGRGKVDWRRVRPGDRVWKTDDPGLDAELRATWSAGRYEPRRGQRGVRWTVQGREGEPLLILDEESRKEVRSAMPLQAATRQPLDAVFLKAQLGRLGQSGFWLEALEVLLEGELMIPVSEVNRMRRSLVESLSGTDARPLPGDAEVRARWEELLPPRIPAGRVEPAELRVLCRNEAQLRAALACGVGWIYADFEDVRRYRDLVRDVRADAPEVRLFLATPRIQKAGESGLFRVIERAAPDGVLVRNLGGAGFFADRSMPRVADFSLNIANPLSAAFFHARGFEHLTISYDLNAVQVLELLDGAPPEWFELTLHQHIPMFHMEHCVFCAFLSEGTDATNCGRPCDRHEVRLRDRVGQLHVLGADVGCRNTLFNGRAQTGARYFGDFRKAGLANYRVELLDEDAGRATEIIRGYQNLLAGVIDGAGLWHRLGAESRLGVTTGTLASP